MFKDKQMIRELLMIFAMILCAVLVSAGILLLNRTEERKLLEQMSEHNASADNLYEALMGMEESLRSIQVDGAQGDGPERYREYAGQLYENLQALAAYAAADQKISENFRKIQEFYEDQEGILKQGYSAASAQQLQDSMPELTACAKVVVLRTFAASTRGYTEAVRLADRTQLTVWGCNAVIFISGIFLIMDRLRRAAAACGNQQAEDKR